MARNHMPLLSAMARLEQQLVEKRLQMTQQARPAGRAVESVGVLF